MKAYELMAILSGLPCNANVLLGGATGHAVRLSGLVLDQDDEKVELEVEVGELEAAEA